VSGEAVHAVPIVGIFFDRHEAAGMGKVFKHLAVAKSGPDLVGMVVSDTIAEGEMVTSGDYGDGIDLHSGNLVYRFRDGFPGWVVV